MGVMISCRGAAKQPATSWRSVSRACVPHHHRLEAEQLRAGAASLDSDYMVDPNNLFSRSLHRRASASVVQALSQLTLRTDWESSLNS